MDQNLVQEYRSKIEPILPLAKKAFGARTKSSPAHEASREYTRLLIEYYNRGGSLPKLAKELKVAYAGLRRRVVMNSVAVSAIKAKATTKLTADAYVEAAQRVKNAKEKGVNFYHEQLAEEYKAGVSLSRLAKELGLSSAAPLYYGVQRSLQKGE
jgi:hypothetical protein